MKERCASFFPRSHAADGQGSRSPGKMNFQDDEFAIAICSFVPNRDDAFFAIVVENLRYTAATPCHRCAKSAIDLISKARYDLVPRSKILQVRLQQAGITVG